jgi:hypothetical protein
MDSNVLDTLALSIITVDKCEQFFAKVAKRTDKSTIKCALSKGILSVRLRSVQKYIQEFKENNFKNTNQVIIILTYTLEDSYNREGTGEELEDLEYLRTIIEELRYLILSDYEDLLLAELKIKEIRTKYQI